MEGPVSFWGYKEQESNLILPEHDDVDDEVWGFNWLVHERIQLWAVAENRLK